MQIGHSPFGGEEPFAGVVDTANPEESDQFIVLIVFLVERDALRAKAAENGK